MSKCLMAQQYRMQALESSVAINRHSPFTQRQMWCWSGSNLTHQEIQRVSKLHTPLKVTQCHTTIWVHKWHNMNYCSFCVIIPWMSYLTIIRWRGGDLRWIFTEPLWWGKDLPLFTDTKVNYCFSILVLYYINNKLFWARKYARIVVRGYYLFRASNCELRGTDNVQGQLLVHISEAKSSLLSLLSFKYFLSQRKQWRENKTKQNTKQNT